MRAIDGNVQKACKRAGVLGGTRALAEIVKVLELSVAYPVCLERHVVSDCRDQNVYRALWSGLADQTDTVGVAQKKFILKVAVDLQNVGCWAIFGKVTDQADVVCIKADQHAIGPEVLKKQTNKCLAMARPLGKALFDSAEIRQWRGFFAEEIINGGEVGQLPDTLGQTFGDVPEE